MRKVGNPYRGELAGPIASGELDGVSPIRLDAVARLTRHETRRDDLALDTELHELPVQCVARRACLVAHA